MAWQSSSRIRIATCLGYPLQQYYLVNIDGGMNSIERQGQESIDYVEDLLAKYEALDIELASAAGDAGLIQADVLHWSDRAGAKLSGQLDRLALLAARVARALGIEDNSVASGGGSCGVIRKVRS